MKTFLTLALIVLSFMTLPACTTVEVEDEPARVQSSTTTTEETRVHQPVSTTTETRAVRSY